MRAENLGQGRCLHQFPDQRLFEEIIPDDEAQACIGARILLQDIYESYGMLRKMSKMGWAVQLRSEVS